jgi:Sulfotransferase family
MRTADRIADLFGVLQGPFDAEEFLATACRRAGVAEFPEPDLLAPVRRFLAALDQEAGLSVLGRTAVHWDVLRLLGNVVRLAQEEARNPAIRAAPLTQPVFVTGLPRSGTTFLHNLLAQDKQVLAPRCWQTINPWPVGTPDRRVATADRQLRSFAMLSPDFAHLHPIRGDSTQECTEITAHCFQSLRFDTLHHIPAYRAWLDQQGHHAAYEFHRRFLQHLQVQSAPEHQETGRWVLKCPDHVFALPAIRAVYPDAHLVFVHRDPLRVLASVAKLTEVLRIPFARVVDPLAIGRQVTTHWEEGARCMMTHASDPANETHLHYRALVADPIGTTRTLYARLGMELDSTAEARMQTHLQAHPNGGYARNSYRFADHGLDPADLTERFGPYLRHFGIESETGAPA